MPFIFTLIRRNMQKILVVSFGTTKDETREKNITSLENAVCEKYGNASRAFTSEMIRKSLSKRDIQIDNTLLALEKMLGEGVTDVKIMPTHLLYGNEYDKMISQVESFKDKFASVRISNPLLAKEDDYIKVIKAVRKETPKDDKTAIILMGHGTDHFVNSVYGAMNFACTENEYEDMYICTVEGYPTFENAVSWILKNGYKKAILAPLMLVAGDHAENDMAGEEEDSLKSMLESHGVEVSCNIKGLCEYSDIKDLYLYHLEEIMN